jgi:transposase
VSNGTRWVGVDLHRRRSQIAIIDEHGELVLSRRIVNEPEMFTELLGDPDGVRVALEASYGWEWLADLLQEGGYEVHLAHPLRVRAIAAGAGEDRRRRRADAGAPVAHRAVAGGVYRPAGAARPARSAPAPRDAGSPANRSRRLETCRQSSIAHTRSPSSSRAHANNWPCPSSVAGAVRV